MGKTVIDVKASYYYDHNGMAIELHTVNGKHYETTTTALSGDGPLFITVDVTKNRLLRKPETHHYQFWSPQLNPSLDTIEFDDIATIYLDRTASGRVLRRVVLLREF